MKKIISISFGVLAAIVLTVSCNQKVDPQTPSNDPGTPSAEKITITATLSDALTKVTFDPAYDSNSKPTGMAHTWQSGDKLRITNASSVSKEFELVSGEGSDTGVFSGNSIDGGPFTVEAVPVSHPGSTDASQAQLADGSTAHLLFVASATGVTDLSNIELSETSNIIGFVAKLPAGAAATINELEIEKSVDDFVNSDKLNITIASPEDVDNDGILKVYANVPASWSIAANTKMFLRFKSTNTAHTVYTRYQEFASAVTPQAGKFNYIKINCSNIDKYAGGADEGTATAPYLIADPYQLLAMDGLLATEKRYFKLLCNIDMDGVAISKLINKDSPYKPFDFDGNSKTISKLSSALFYIISNGSVKDITLDGSDVKERGALAEYIQGSGNVVSKVTVTNGKVNSSSSNVGGLVGNINSTGTSATITNCTVSDTDVTGVGVVGGLIGFADAQVTISGCTYKGGTLTSTARFCGGMLGSTGNYASVISDCHVEDAIVSASIANNDYRTGGFVGQLQTSCTVKGCSVGTASKPVTITLSAPTSGKVYNAGGFVGVNYGTITKDGDTRNTAYVGISSDNAEGTAQLNVGGFVAFNQGTTMYSDSFVSSTSIKGSHIGGFAGILTGGTIENCTSNGTLAGTQKSGGFVGVAQNGTIRECSATAVISKVGTTSGTGNGCDFGGFVGEITQTATLIKCHVESDVTINASYVGGFAGSVNPASGKTATISRCWSTGNVTSSSSQCGCFIGHIAANETGTVNVSDCYVTGTHIETNQRQGGLVGQINSGIVTISRCYTTSALTSGSFAQGGLVGFMNATATIQDCAAWNSDVTAGSIGSGNWSTGAVIGVAWPIATITNNFRKPGINVKAFWGNVSGYAKELVADYDHPDVSSTSPLIVADKASGTLRATTATAAASGQDNYPQFAYHGKHSTTSRLSTLASTAKASGGLGWSSDIWDFTGDLPTLK